MKPLYTPEQIETITKHYLIALLWVAPSLDDNDSPGDGLNLSDIPADIYNEARQDVIEFVEQCGELFTLAMQCYDDGYGQHPDAGSAEAAFGHDYALTRNGHGCGFWDRESEGLPRKLGDKLTKICQHKEKNLLIESDGSIYYE